MRKIQTKQRHNEWKLCFLGGERGGYEPRNTKPAMSSEFKMVLWTQCALHLFQLICILKFLILARLR